MRRVFAVVFWSLVSGPAAWAGYGLPANGYYSVRDTLYYWEQDDSVFQAKVREEKLIGPDSVVEESIVSMPKSRFRERLRFALQETISTDYADHKLIAFLVKQIELNEKKLEAPGISQDEKEKVTQTLLEQKRSLTEATARTVEAAQKSIELAVLTPKELVYVESSSIAPKKEYVGQTLKDVFSGKSLGPPAVKAKQMYHSLVKEGFVPTCEYTKFSITVRGLSPTTLTHEQATRKCDSLGMALPDFAYMKDVVSWSVYDYDGSMTCRRFAQSAIGKKLRSYETTGSSVPGIEKILWLKRSSPLVFRGYGCPLAGSSGDVQAMYLSANGDSCLINPSCQPVDPSWSLETVCTSRQMWSQYPIAEEELGFPCEKVTP